MLNKIANIEMNTSGKKSGSKFRKQKFGEVYSAHSINFKDSLSINPAFRLLNHFGIIIKELHKHSQNSSKLLLQIDNFIFDLKSSTGDLLSSKGIEYDIWEANEKNTDTFKILLTTKTMLRNDFSEIDSLSLDSLKFLFSRCHDLGIDSEINSRNTLAVNNLLDKIYTRMIEEFTNINSIIVRFYDLLNGTKILDKLINEHDFNELIILKRIVPLNGKDN